MSVMRMGRPYDTAVLTLQTFILPHEVHLLQHAHFILPLNQKIPQRKFCIVCVINSDSDYVKT